MAVLEAPQVRFDDVIEANPYPLEEIDRCVKANRRVGLGVMGWADLLIMMKLRYDSEPATEGAQKDDWGLSLTLGYSF